MPDSIEIKGTGDLALILDQADLAELARALEPLISRLQKDALTRATDAVRAEMRERREAARRRRASEQ